MGETILKMQGIQKYFSGVHALKSVNFELRAGEVHALMGENGAGKSTLLRIINGIYKQNSGSVTIDGENIVNVINDKSESNYTDVRYNTNTQTILSNNEPILTITLLRSDVIDCDINERLEILNELTSWVVNKLSN